MKLISQPTKPMPHCPCCSTIPYTTCCEPFHLGQPAPTAQALMRSRYAAYALGKLDYIEATCAGPAASGFDRAEAELSQLGVEWLGLEIVATKKGRVRDEEGMVTFRALFRHHGETGEHLETSLFKRSEGRWVYWDRDVTAKTPSSKSIGRNDPCPCGSSKKYKTCCA